MELPRLIELLELAPDATVVVDRAGRIVRINGTAERLLGYHNGELGGQPIEILVPGRLKEAHRSHRNAYLASPEVRSMGAALDLHCRRKDGSEFPTDISLSPLETTEGPLVIAAIRDTTERRRLERALHLSTERFRLLVDSVEEYAIFMLDREGRVATWNRGAQRIKGYAAQEIIGQPFAIFHAQEDIALGKPRKALAYAAEHGEFREEAWRVRKDGSRFRADVTITRLSDERGTLLGYAKVTRDVSARTRAEDERRRAVEAREEILALVAHDLQNAVNALVLNAEVITRTSPVTATETAMQAAGVTVARSAEGMKRLIRDLLDVQQIELGSFTIEPRTEPVAGLAEAAIEPLLIVAHERSIRLVLELDPDVPLVSCDAERVVQVLHNLIGNAIKFADEGGVVTLCTATSPAGVRFSVSDGGPGMAPEELPFVFDRSWRAPQNKLQRGSGLGLFIVKTIVEAHGGRVWVESQLGGGTTFFFTLPVASSTSRLP